MTESILAGKINIGILFQVIRPRVITYILSGVGVVQKYAVTIHVVYTYCNA